MGTQCKQIWKGSMKSEWESGEILRGAPCKTPLGNPIKCEWVSIAKSMDIISNHKAYPCKAMEIQ